MKKRTLITIAALLLAVCLPFSACSENPDTLTDEEMQAAMDAEREAAMAAYQEEITEPEPTMEIPRTVTVTAESPERLLYRDDTTIVYTVETPRDCTEVIMSLLYREYSIMLQMKDYTQEEQQYFEETDKVVLWAYNCPLRQQSFTPQSEGVTVEERENTLVWTIPCDFGLTGAERVAAEAVCPGDDWVRPFGIVNVNIRYPSYNTVDEVELAVRAAIAFNQDAPYFFICDLSQTSIDFDHVDSTLYTHATLFGMTRFLWQYGDIIADLEKQLGVEYGTYWDYAMRDPDVYGGNMYVRMPYYEQIATSCWTNSESGTELIDLTGMYVPDKEGVVLCGMRLGNEDILLPQADPDWLKFMICPETRVSICHQMGVTVNAEDFPSAAVVQAEAEEVIARCIQPGMTDFEKARALFDWMYERNKTAELPENYDGLSEDERYMYQKTSYGFMTHGFGDCMGWSGTYSMLCNMAGIKSILITCDTVPGGPTLEDFGATHRLSALILDGELYYTDVYWSAAGSAYTVPQYQYFLMTTEQAAEYYTWNGNLGIPEMNATKYAVDPVTGELLH